MSEFGDEYRKELMESLPAELTEEEKIKCPICGKIWECMGDNDLHRICYHDCGDFILEIVRLKSEQFSLRTMQSREAQSYRKEKIELQKIIEKVLELYKQRDDSVRPFNYKWFVDEIKSILEAKQ